MRKWLPLLTKSPWALTAKWGELGAHGLYAAESLLVDSPPSPRRLVLTCRLLRCRCRPDEARERRKKCRRRKRQRKQRSRCVCAREEFDFKAHRSDHSASRRRHDWPTFMRTERQ